MVRSRTVYALSGTVLINLPSGVELRSTLYLKCFCVAEFLLYKVYVNEKSLSWACSNISLLSNIELRIDRTS